MHTMLAKYIITCVQVVTTCGTTGVICSNLFISYLTHTEAPQRLLRQRNVTIPYESRTSLWCQAQGSPAPVITWFKDGKLLQNSTSVVYSLPWNDQEGSYICEAKNSFGSSRTTLLVFTQSKQDSY